MTAHSSAADQSHTFLMWHEACEFKQRLSLCNLLPARLLCAANMTDKLMHFCVQGNFLEQMGAKLDQHAAPAFVALQGFLRVWYP